MKIFIDGSEITERYLEKAAMLVSEAAAAEDYYTIDELEEKPV